MDNLNFLMIISSIAYIVCLGFFIKDFMKLGCGYGSLEGYFIARTFFARSSLILFIIGFLLFFHLFFIYELKVIFLVFIIINSIISLFGIITRFF